VRSAEAILDSCRGVDETFPPIFKEISLVLGSGLLGVESSQLAQFAQSDLEKTSLDGVGLSLVERFGNVSVTIDSGVLLGGDSTGESSAGLSAASGDEIESSVVLVGGQSVSVLVDETRVRLLGQTREVSGLSGECDSVSLDGERGRVGLEKGEGEIGGSHFRFL